MTTPEPLACSLQAGDLRARLEEIAAVSRTSLIATETGGVPRLRFRSDPETQRRLEAIVAAEAECCSFLQLDLLERGEELVLTIAAPEDGRAIVDQLAAAFLAARP